jgi:hypothetical protein
MTDTPEIVEDHTNYWAVGSSSGTKDFSKFFIDNKIWEDALAKGGNDVNKPLLDMIKKGDYLLMHTSTAAKGKSASRTKSKLKAIGKVMGRVKDNYYTFFVSWDVKDAGILPKEFNDIWYNKSIESMRVDEMLRYARKLIRQ